MFEPASEFASDLEWMIQSGQVSRDILLEALVQEFYPRIYHLLVSLLDDQKAAKKASQETFARAIAELHRFRAQEGVEKWLFQIALSACLRAQSRLHVRRSIQSAFPFSKKLEHLGDSVPESNLDAELWLAIDGLDDYTRQVISLYYVLGWSTEQIALLFPASETEIASALETGRRWAFIVLHTIQGENGINESLLEVSFLDEVLKKSLQARWPPQVLTSDELRVLSSPIHRRSRWISLQQRRVVIMIEILILLTIIIVALGSTWYANQGEAGVSTPTFTPPFVTVVVTKIVYKIVTQAPDQAEIRATPSAFQSLSNNQYTFTRSGETLEQVAARLGTTANTLRELNRLPGGTEFQSGQRLLNPQMLPAKSYPMATPVPPLKPGEPLKEGESPDTLLYNLNIQPTVYANVWFDASLIDYGHASYIGPPRVTRFQTWIEKGKSLTIIGYADQAPEEIILQKGEQTYIASPNRDALWYAEWRRLRDGSTVTPEILKYIGISPFDIHDLSRGYTFRFDLPELSAGNLAYVINQLDRTGARSGRLWIDQETGFLLRRIRYLEGESGLPAAEFKIHSIAYNVEFPQSLFDHEIPWRGGFAQDYRGQPLELNAPKTETPAGRPRIFASPLPSNFNLGASQLIFQFPESFQATEAASQVQLIADQYAAGSVIFGNPWESICARSPDGQWIAFVSQPVHARNPNSLLNWFNLSDPLEQFYTQYDQMGVTEFAFSPDSQRLAYFHNRNSSGFGYLSVVDISKQLSRFLIRVGDIKSLVWSPDGVNLAMIVRFDPSSYLENVIAVEVDTGQIIYSAPIDYQSNAVKDWPMEEWGVEFPVEMGDLGSCSLPPIHAGTG